MLNGAPLNGLPINALIGAGPARAPVRGSVGSAGLQLLWPDVPAGVVVVPNQPQPDPGEPWRFTLGLGISWRLRLLVDGVDLSHRLTGTVTIDREEGAAALADFSLLLEGAFRPADWYGRSVTIDYISEGPGGRLESRRFTGCVAQPKFNPRSRILTCECSDQLQQRVAAMSIADIDQLTGGHWSADVFESVEGRDRWEYAMERMSTRAASLDSSPSGDLRVTSWFAEPEAHFYFGPGTTLDDSVRVELGDAERLINVVEITFHFRFPRLYQLNHSYSWVHPGLGGFTGEQGFCLWRRESTELPDIDMIRSATASSGQTLLSGGYHLLPKTGVYCDPPAAWKNDFPNLVLSASWTAGRRWAQSVTESYTLRLVHAPGVAVSGENVYRDSLSLEVGSERAEAWESEGFSSGSTGHEDVREEARRQLAGRCLLEQGAVRLISAARDTTLMFEVLTSMALGLDLVHTVELEDQGAHGRGKCRRIYDTFNLDSGLATTSVGMAIMVGGGGRDDARILPPGSSAPPISGGGTTLPTQLGGLSTSPPYDPDRDGFSGNYSWVDNDVGQEPYPRRMAITAPEIPAELRDEHKVAMAAEYEVAIPGDPLEL